MTDCVCQPERFPHWCQRHECEKSSHWVRLCRDRDDYFELWEAGRGPGQSREQDTPRKVRLKVTILFLAHNRLEYTQLALESLLESRYPNFEVVVWDNASDDGTRKWLVDTYGRHPNVTLILAPTNMGVVRPMNAVWGMSDAPLVAKVDNDTLVPPDWLARLAGCFADSKQLGVLSGCHFRPDDVGCAEKNMRHNVDGIAVLRQKHVGGCAVMMRRSLFEEFGPIEITTPTQDTPFAESGWTLYQDRLHKTGYVNGYALPLCFVEHMEDTRSPYCIRTREHENYKIAMRGFSLSENTQNLYVRRAGRYFGQNAKPHSINGHRKSIADKPLTLFIPLAGRTALWPQLAGFLERQTWPHDQTKLVLMDTCHEEDFSQKVRKWVANCDYADVRHVRWKVGEAGIADLPRRQATVAVRRAVAQIYNRLANELNTSLLWILEDDVLPPDDVCERLIRHLDENTYSVAAPVWSRFNEHFIAWDQQQRNFRQRGEGVQVVGGNSLGCALIRSRSFKGSPFPPGKDVDREFYRRQADSRLIAKLDWSCECQHCDVPNSGASRTTVEQGAIS